MLISSEIRAHHGKSCLNGELLLGLYLDHDPSESNKNRKSNSFSSNNSNKKAQPAKQQEKQLGEQTNTTGGSD